MYLRGVADASSFSGLMQYPLRMRRIEDFLHSSLSSRSSCIPRIRRIWAELLLESEILTGNLRTQQLGSGERGAGARHNSPCVYFILCGSLSRRWCACNTTSRCADGHWSCELIWMFSTSSTDPAKRIEYHTSLAVRRQRTPHWVAFFRSRSLAMDSSPRATSCCVAVVAAWWLFLRGFVQQVTEFLFSRTRTEQCCVVSSLVAYPDLRRCCGGLECFIQCLYSYQSTMKGLHEPRIQLLNSIELWI